MGELALLVPLAPFLMVAFIVWTKHRSKIEELRMRTAQDQTSESAAQHAAHTRELEERVRVLERIITDRGFDVATQIEALRDKPAAALTDRSEKERLS